MMGLVYLVGAGPGDPGLLTHKAARVLEDADVVVYDHLVGDAILDRLPPRVERVYAGKETGSHVMDQAGINGLLEERARRGQTVVRLKGGDPFVFGRGGEEAEHLAAREIPFEVVPGVTSAIGVPAYAGIPVTHRGVAASLAVVTGRAGPIGEAPDVEWERIAGADTIVVLMGVANQELLVRTLMDSGRSPETPAAAIRWGTTARQRVVVGTLATIGARLCKANLRPPAILVVGDVVTLIPRIRWADRRPLFGHRVLLPSAHPSPLTEPLERLGAEVLHVSPVEVGPPLSWEPIDRVLAELASFAGVVFADESGVGTLFERLMASGRDARSLAGSRLVAATERARGALERRAVRSDAVLDGDLRALGVSKGERWLVVGSPDTQDAFANTLRAAGAVAVAPPVLRLTAPKWRADRVRELLSSRPVRAIVFESAAEVRRLLGALDAQEWRALRGAVLVTVGRAALDALREHGFEPQIVARETSPAVAEVLAGSLGSPEDPCAAEQPDA